VFRHLHITNRRERWLVGLADLILRVLAAAGRLLGAGRPVEHAPLRRILLVRLERVGDLLMVLDAMAMVRELAPSARIDLVVGRWNAALAGIIPGIDSVETLDAPWMARAGAGQSWPALLRHAWGWRVRRYDLAINFESDIRSNLLLWLSGARRRVGFGSGGGGALLTDAVVADRTEHVAANASLLVARAFDQPAAAAADVPGRELRRTQRLDIPAAARQRATALLADVGESERLVGLQPGAGRQLREWDPARFGAVAKELARGGPVTFVLTGSAADAAALAGVTTTWPRDLRLIVLPVDTDLVVLAAVIERLSLFITGDTGPMHLAAAMGTPIVAIFGPSLPSRYAPLSGDARIVRIDLPCSPCNRLREPPARCVGHVPDCLAGIEPAQVVQAANELLGRGATKWPLRALDATPS
jgi:lipopolysaccharide heptosyltransferase II